MLPSQSRMSWTVLVALLVVIALPVAVQFFFRYFLGWRHGLILTFVALLVLLAATYVVGIRDKG
jgi:hypothetical protein